VTVFRVPVDPYRQAELLLATLEHLGDGLSVVDANLDVLAFNSRALDLLGFPPEQAADWKNLADFFRYNAERGEYGPGDVEAMVRERCEQARRFEPHLFRRTRPNGTVLEIRGTPLPGGGMLTTYRDVTADARASEELRRERDLRQQMVDSLPGIFYLISPDGRFLWWNHQFESVTGYDASEMSTLHPLDLFEGDERDALATAIGQVFEHGHEEIEATLVTKTGRHIHYYFTGERIEIDGQPTLIGLGIDITERKTAENLVRSLNATLEDRVRRRTAELEARSSELEAFSYSVAHDLRGPLRAIDGFAHLIAEDCGEKMPEVGHNHLRRIRAASQRLGILIDDLLDLARISRHEIRNVAVDLSARVAALRRELSELDSRRPVTWRIAESCVVSGDPTLLDHLMDNLVRNAWKFTAERRPAEIEFGRIAATPKENVFFVRDNGAGFDMEHAAKLFQPFQRLHHPDRFTGTGIGLAIAARVVQRHGGRIWAESTPEQGSTFFFALPVGSRA
jgi:PAS domain S-box-containing protein